MPTDSPSSNTNTKSDQSKPDSKSTPKSDHTHSDQSKLDSKTTPKSTNTNPTNRHALRYLFVGIGITIFNFAFYSILANLIIRNNDLLWLSTFISTAVTTIVAYLAHSRITWKDRHITKHSIIRFLIWNALLAVAIGPWITQLFSLFTPLYEFAFSITSALHLPFTYEFVLTTGAFVLTAIVTMILNFLFYDRFVFGKPKSPSHSNSPK